MVDTPWHTMQIDEVIRNLVTNTDTGLSRIDAENRLKKYGHNQLEEKEGVLPIMLFLGQFNDFIVWVIAAADTCGQPIVGINPNATYLNYCVAKIP